MSSKNKEGAAQGSGKFSSRLGFVLASAGAAVGLGNIWRFPYLCARQGGGIFLLVYLVMAFTMGSSVLLTENAIGRKTGRSVLGAFGALNRKWTFLGWLAAAVPLVLLPYYSVIGGWVVKYFISFAIGQGSSAAQDGYFESFVADPVSSLVLLFVFIALTAVIVAMGVQKGVERAARFLMPALIIIAVVVAIYAISLPGGMDGLRYVFYPDFTRFSMDTLVAAMGMVFYSLSLGAGVMVTYGSYMKKDEDMVAAGHQVEYLDTGMAVLTSLMLIPAVFVFSGGSEDALTVGPSLLFVTMPKVFDSMGGFGPLMGTAFFVLVLFAAITSAISIMECVVRIVIDKLHWKRVWATSAVSVSAAIIGVPSVLGYSVWSGVTAGGMNILETFDLITNSILLPGVACLTAILIGWAAGPKTVIDEAAISSGFRGRRLYSFLIKWVDPIIIGWILVSTLLQGLGVMAEF